MGEKTKREKDPAPLEGGNGRPGNKKRDRRRGQCRPVERVRLSPPFGKGGRRGFIIWLKSP
jgi:hypothetical protein